MDALTTAMFPVGSGDRPIEVDDVVSGEVFEMKSATMRGFLIVAIGMLVAMTGGTRVGHAEEKPMIPPAAKRAVDFVRDIKPLLKDHCWKCHGANKQRGDLRLDEKGAAMKGGESFAPAIIPGSGAESPLVKFPAGVVEGLQMPPEGEKKLTKDEVGLLRAWIDQGAKWPDKAPKQRDAEHWSFQPLKRPVISPVSPVNADWVMNPVDRFIAAKLQTVGGQKLAGTPEGIAPSAAADRVTLIRRATFDLVGLPATLNELTEFLAETRPDAFERLVDRLLASPHFGERWARHWLDVVKFAESDGFETNQPRPNAWPYRDYVIRAFNEDKPFDRFLFEQLAGDSVGADDATGFLVTGAMDRVKSPDPGLTAQQRADELHDMVSTTTSAFVGLTVGCARCHNHKFDPISQTDYYSIKAVFAGVQHGERPLKPADFEQRQLLNEQIKTKLAVVEQKLANYEPLSFVSRRERTVQHSDATRQLSRTTLLLGEEFPGDSGAASQTMVIPRQGFQPYPAGRGKGELNDPGDSQRFPNLGRSYSHWSEVPRRDLQTWNPGVNGAWHIWLSWGCGWETHSPDARYVLDRDGDLTTQHDQQEIAKVDQRRFADGTGGAEGKPLWSGFFDAGVHELTFASKIILRGGDTTAFITADLICLQEGDVETVFQKPTLPQLRPSVHRQTNVDRFPPIKARFVRFVIEATTGSEPCLDELEVFETMATPQTIPRNVALSSLGTVATSSSNLPGFDIHQLAFVNDGRYGNTASWISNEPGRGWVQLEFPAAVEIDRVLWSRDRPESGQFQDRLATRYRIEAGMTPESMQVVATSEDRLPFDRKLTSLPTLVSVRDEERAVASQLAAERSSLRQRLQTTSTTAVIYAGRFSTPEPTHRLHRGDPLQPREATMPAGLASFGSPWTLSETAIDADRRQALAKWMNSPDHPLTARVMANRIWHFHFGQGLVPTPSDFGRNGLPPSNPALLDWLASETQSTSSPKKLHRLMVTSATYRQSGEGRPEGLQADATTQFLWRYPPRRLEAEALRDAMLSVAGNLDDRMYGPGFDLFEPNTNYVKVYNSKREMGPAEWRRMVYQAKPRMQLDEIFGQFDCPDAGQIAPKRTSSITALQALNLLNSRFVLKQSSQFAARLRDEAGSELTAQVQLAFRLAFHREPSADELGAGVELVLEYGLESFCRATLNANEFLFVF